MEWFSFKVAAVGADTSGYHVSRMKNQGFAHLVKAQIGINPQRKNFTKRKRKNEIGFDNIGVVKYFKKHKYEDNIMIEK